jgi:sterol desaturase/sphingolipid hydroxylase (fatty acid hydroxylase superfamily)
MLVGLCAFFIALLIGTFVEYWLHRAMHQWLLKKRHARHHQEGTGQGWLLEFKDYFLGTFFVLPVGFLLSIDAGIGFVAGGLFYTFWAAYSHQLQHEKPELCFWIASPVHYLHHHHHMWHYNFGISTDLWDRVFRTYKKVDWNPAPKHHSLWSWFQIKWI